MPAALAVSLEAAQEGRCALLIGTTGLEAEHHAAIDAAARDIAVLQAANTSLGVTLLARLVDGLGLGARLAPLLGAAVHRCLGGLEGALDLGGTLPCNTHGGMLSHGGPGVAGGLAHVVEAVTQLRHAAGARQVANARTAFVHGDGGVLSTHCSLVLGTG